VSDLAPLRVAGRHLASRRDDRPVVLRGVNRSGLEYAEPSSTRGFLDAAGLAEGDIDEIVRAWGATIVRVPFNQDFALNGRGGRTSDDYLAALDQVVAWAAARGAYTLLDLQWIDADTPRGTNADGTINRVPALPDARTIDVWRRLAVHYRDEPAVLFDLFNEPHDPLFDDLTPLDGIREDGAIVRLSSRQVGMAEWQPWAHRLVEVIRCEHPDAVIFVSGVAWAFDLRGFPLRNRRGEPLPNLVYSTHVYPWSRTGLVRLGSYEAEWARAFGRLAETHAVFAAEWGGDAGSCDWGRRLEAWLRARGIGWTGWSWADWPRLVADCRACDYTPTPFGTLVRDALRRPCAAG
jgi:endoglucanase